ncbi:16S rRNA (adenine(1518)-N(6)/adenine(1519)-N(6))-dimethyltransferase RsmA [Gluconacetobacter takamatsuzukensis]|uniref:Ribosomal RNA small subunit methyltransferase A n=1 Tax=Gluconacetobacter takamatsuzukensis TaxID=1286190 RepID=A0A7W4KB57_9PROT|nr:16S rRNA (adenine(1518)-N(6)/adenine(1519)-N(6))-dimethyltransferase RsmA [Gluconacetobacter takamatsuzukensis]MBB2203701.1 16S rRNA (adenine(1518)-N(6)/adenine(1519)-N(6))-dimethyltransferase RsmA [Gluconacetobacter takamatsuzukensis]
MPVSDPVQEPLRDVIARHGLDARKALGQHFLLDPGITARIAALAGDLAGRHVVEVGPGPGGLTRSLLATTAASVTAVEIDRRAVAVIEELVAHFPGRLRLVEADATRHDLTELCPPPRQIVANLPYNVGTPLLVGWLRQAASWERLTLMFQMEVAERICAAPDTSHYGRLAVLAQWTCQAALVMRIPPGAFSPPPKVHSAVVSLIPHPTQPEPALFRAMEQVTAAAFGQRRKMLRGSLRGIGGEILLAEAGIAGDRRAETLSIPEFDRLARCHAARTA